MHQDGRVNALERFARRAVTAAERLLGRLRRFSRGPHRWIALGIAAALFVVQCVIAFRRLPELQPAWGAVVLLVLVGTPLNLFATGVEYALVARLLGQRPGSGHTLRVSFLASASNLLPVPGSVFVRGANLRAGGARYRDLTAGVAAQGLAFLSVTGLFAGAVLLPSGNPGLGLAGLAFGVATLVASIRLLARVTDQPFAWAGRLLAGELAVLLVTAVRIWIAALALGYRLDAPGTAALTAASVAATATGIFPGGLGIREALSAGVSPLVRVPASVGVLIGAVDRIAFLIGLGLAGAAIALSPGGRQVLRIGSAVAGEVEEQPGHAAVE
jgi:hypothetical protein